MSDANTTTSDVGNAMSDTNATLAENYNAINLRLSHPNLFRSILTFAVLSIGLGLNFLLLTPPFNGYGIPVWIVGITFLALGIAKVIFLTIQRNLKAVRFTMALEVGWMLFWGIGTSITYFQGRTTLQLFILYVGMAAFETFLLLEPFANPLTGRKGA